jgi:hypothetical protein
MDKAISRLFVTVNNSCKLAQTVYLVYLRVYLGEYRVGEEIDGGCGRASEAAS